MRVIVIGAGRIGTSVVHDLARSERVEKITVVDIEYQKAKLVADKHGLGKAIPKQSTTENLSVMASMMKEADVVVSAGPPNLHIQLAKLAIEAGVSLCDSGGDPNAIESKLALDSAARQNNVTVVPDCGLAPGLANVLVAHGTQKLDATDEIHVYVGGLPQNPKPPLDYALVFSIEALVEEYTTKARVIKNGRVMELEPLSELEEITFPTIGKFEAFITPGTSTLIKTFEGRVRELDEKTIRYSGHSQKIRALKDLGLLDNRPIELEGHNITPRDFLARLLEQKLPRDEKDIVLMRVIVKGRKGDSTKTIKYELVDYYDERLGMTAMMRSTGFTISIISQMIGSHEIFRKGIIPPELAVPPIRLIWELSQRGLIISESILDE